MKKLFLLCLSLAVALGAVAEISVCDVNPDENGHFDCSFIKSGSIIWNEGNHTLTLNNAVVEYTSETPYDYVYPIRLTEDATIIIRGECELTTTGFVAIGFEGTNSKNVTIQGDGNLYLASIMRGIYLKCARLTIKDITLQTTKGIMNNGDGVLCALSFNNVQADINGVVENIGEGISFQNCAITYPEEAYIEHNDYGYYIADGDGSRAGHIMISRTSNFKGDVNGDGEVNIADVNAVIDVILGGGSNAAADVNHDGEINIADINAIIDIILGGDDNGVFTVNIPMVNHMYSTVTNQVVGVTNTSNKLVLDTIHHTAQLELVYNDGVEHTVSYRNLTAHASRTGFFELASPSDPNFNGYVDFNEVSFRYIYMTADGLRIISTSSDVFFLNTENTIEYDDTTETTRMENVIYQFNLNADERTATVMVMGIVHAKDMRYLIRVAAPNVPFTLTPNGYSFTGENIATTTMYRTADAPNIIKTTSEYPFETLNVNVDLMGDQIVANYMLGSHATVNATGKTYPDFGSTSDDHDYVDLGLPSGTLWATCNVGANAPEECGDYFAWGETEPKEAYNISSYKWCNGSENTMTKYCTNSSYGTVDNKTELDPDDDAAYVNWGPSWRMPTKEQQDELIVCCTTTWTTRNGVNGQLLTGRNGNSIFLPAAGRLWGESLSYSGSEGDYWSRTLHLDFSYGAYFFSVYSDGMGWGGSPRYVGFTVRAVRASQN